MHATPKNTSPSSTRRHYLQRAAIGLAAVAATAAGLVGWAVKRPQTQLAQGLCAGASPMKRKVLIAYASRAGSTGEVAQAISERLCAQGFDAEVRPVDSVKSLDGFQAVVLGSAIRYSAWLPEMLKFVESQRSALATVPVVIFTAHIQALDDSEASVKTRSTYTQVVRALITPRAEAFLPARWTLARCRSSNAWRSSWSNPRSATSAIGRGSAVGPMAWSPHSAQNLEAADMPSVAPKTRASNSRASWSASRAVLTLLLCLSWIHAWAQSTPVALDPALIERIDRFVVSEVQASGIPGAALAIVNEGRIAHSRGFGDNGRNQAVTADTPFPIGSLTKSFTALLTRQLIEAGQVDPDAALQHYLPWFSVADADASTQITVRHLLNQTSGLSRADGITPLLHHNQADIKTLARSLSKTRLNRSVGTHYEYSNLNFVLLGALVQQVSGQAWAELVRERVFQPLDMRHSHSDQDSARRDGMTELHRYWFGVPIRQALAPMAGLAPTGGLVSSANDMAHYLALMVGGGDVPASGVPAGGVPARAVLSSGGIAQLLSPASPLGHARLQSTDFEFRYGEGWFVGRFGQAADARWHLGELPSFTAWMVLLPDTKQAVVVLINANASLPFGGINAALSRIPVGVVNLLRGQPAPGGPSIPSAYRVFNVAAALPVIGLAALAWWAARSRRKATMAWSMAGAAVMLAPAPQLLGLDPAMLMSFAPDFALTGVACLALLCLPALVRAARFLVWHLPVRHPRQNQPKLSGKPP
jgi:CubicO group peptidase (beta-lactamase class C family)